MRADAEARKVNGIRLKPIKHKKLYGLGQTGVSRNSFRNLLCCAFFRCAKFRAKLAMLCISPKPNLSRNSPPWRGKDIVRDRN